MALVLLLLRFGARVVVVAWNLLLNFVQHLKEINASLAVFEGRLFQWQAQIVLSFETDKVKEVAVKKLTRNCSD